MKISIITVVFNGGQYLEDCIRSVLAQDHNEIEYIIIDGGSSDNTIEIIEKFKDKIDFFISEPDKGLYDAINKGIGYASGDVIGLLHADDYFGSSNVISKIAEAFERTDADGVYGDLNYVGTESLQTIRRWVSKTYDRGIMQWGWMPAHPTLYLKRKIFDSFGLYSLDFGSAADYEMMLRLIHKKNITIAYIPELIVNMRVGGQSNASWKHRQDAFVNDLKAAREHSLKFPFSTIMLKKLRKVIQYF